MKEKLVITVTEFYAGYLGQIQRCVPAAAPTAVRLVSDCALRGH